MKGTKFTTPFGKILQRLLAAGVGVHHAGMRRATGFWWSAWPSRAPARHLRHRHPGRGHQRAHPHRSAHPAHQVRRHQDAPPAQPRVPPDRRAGGPGGFDTEGMAIALAHEHEIENHEAPAEGRGRPKKQRCVKKKQPPEGFVSWNKQTFEHLIEKPPEKLTPRMRITHSMVLSVVSRGGDACGQRAPAYCRLGPDPRGEIKLNALGRRDFRHAAGSGRGSARDRRRGQPELRATCSFPEDFALDQPLSPFLLAALDLLYRRATPTLWTSSRS